jgi:hypothetical protein
MTPAVDGRRLLDGLHRGLAPPAGQPNRAPSSRREKKPSYLLLSHKWVQQSRSLLASTEPRQVLLRHALFSSRDSTAVASCGKSTQLRNARSPMSSRWHETGETKPSGGCGGGRSGHGLGRWWRGTTASRQAHGGGAHGGVSDGGRAWARHPRRGWRHQWPRPPRYGRGCGPKTPAWAHDAVVSGAGALASPLLRLLRRGWEERNWDITWLQTLSFS